VSKCKAVFALASFHNSSAQFLSLRGVLTKAGPSRCGAQCKFWARGPSDFTTSSCSVNRVTIVVERRYTVQH